MAKAAAPWGAHRKLAVTGELLVAFSEGNEAAARRLLPLFDAVEQGEVTAHASTLALGQLLVTPHRAADESAVQELSLLWGTYPHLSFAPLDAAIANQAAGLVARCGVDWPAAVDAATALAERCDALVATDEPRYAPLAREISVIFLTQPGAQTPARS